MFFFKNVCYNFKGHGYFLEDGTEQNNKIIRNLAMMAMPPSSNKLLLRSDDVSKSENQGRFPAVLVFGYLIQITILHIMLFLALLDRVFGCLLKKK